MPRYTAPCAVKHTELSPGSHFCPSCGQMLRDVPKGDQELVWIPEAPDTRSMRTVCRAALHRRPRSVWTLLREQDLNKKPTLPILPVHGQNAFFEDFIHDWHYARGELRYFSRICNGGVWVLVEFDDLVRRND